MHLHAQAYSQLIGLNTSWLGCLNGSFLDQLGKSQPDRDNSTVRGNHAKTLYMPIKSADDSLCVFSTNRHQYDMQVVDKSLFFWQVMHDVGAKQDDEIVAGSLSFDYVGKLPTGNPRFYQRTSSPVRRFLSWLCRT